MNISKSFNFWSLAKDFLSAAKAVKTPTSFVRSKAKFNLIWPAYFLIGHSIELSLKSYLVAQGYELNLLRSKKYGHNLKVLLDEAQSRKLGSKVKFSKQQTAAIIMLNKVYCSKKFEYLEYGKYQCPEYKYIYITAQVLLNGLASYVSNPPNQSIVANNLLDTTTKEKLLE